MSDGTPMIAGTEKEPRVRREQERGAVQAIEFFVHDAFRIVW
jgi:hypothetical protein